MVSSQPDQVFAIPMRDVPWPQSGNYICPVCQGPWRPFTGSCLPCHARCVWTREAALWLLAEERAASVLAKEIGVTLHVVLGGIRAGRKYLEAERVPKPR